MKGYKDYSMALAAKVKHFLDSHHVSYRVLQHQRTATLEEAVRVLGIDPRQVVQAVLLKDRLNVELAVFPLGHQIDLMHLFRQTGRLFGILSNKDSDKFFKDCEPSSRPPFGKAYDISLILDKKLADMEQIYFEAGSHTALIQITKDDFQFLTAGEPYLSFVVPCELQSISLAVGVLQSTSFEKHTNEIENKYTFDLLTNNSIQEWHNSQIGINVPSLPPIARQILEIANNPSDEAVLALSNLISKDAIIHAHVLAAARHYLEEGKNETVSSLQEVITEILGFKMVSHIALGITAGRVFRIPEEGVLGLQGFWRHALYSAMLAKKIAEKVPISVELDPHLSYLMGFFHNFGYLLLGHLFPPEFRLLNRWLLRYPKIPIEALEKRLLGMGQAMSIVGNGHAQLGAWLMQYWGMPESIVAVTRSHHAVNHEGVYAGYIVLLQLTNQLLRASGLGDGQSGKLNEKWLQQLGLSACQVEECVKVVQKGTNSLDRMAIVLAN